MDTAKLSNIDLKILLKLSEAETLSGNVLAEQLEISRTAVWKHINALKKQGFKIECLPRAGYKLLQPAQPLFADKIMAALTHLDSTQEILLDVFSKLTSTNDYVKLQCHQGIHICISEQQTMGRGRFERQWHSPFGDNLYLSIQKQLNLNFTQLSGLSLVISLAVLKGLERLGILTSAFAIKWPNDILLEGKKLAGILIELAGEVGGKPRAVIGLGMNVNMVDADIDRSWHSLKHFCQRDVDRNQLAIVLIGSIVEAVQQFEQHGFDVFYEQWQQYDAMKDKSVTLNLYDKKINGICRGIDEQGNLLLQQNDGVLQKYQAGEVSFNTKVY
jgi:BirA family biotin operon repressor/biotin-[acetyl-CoA-carboxylase] ligase